MIDSKSFLEPVRRAAEKVIVFVLCDHPKASSALAGLGLCLVMTWSVIAVAGIGSHTARPSVSSVEHTDILVIAERLAKDATIERAINGVALVTSDSGNRYRLDHDGGSMTHEEFTYSVMLEAGNERGLFSGSDLIHLQELFDAWHYVLPANITPSEFIEGLGFGKSVSLCSSQPGDFVWYFDAGERRGVSAIIGALIYIGDTPIGFEALTPNRGKLCTYKYYFTGVPGPDGVLGCIDVDTIQVVRIKE